MTKDAHWNHRQKAKRGSPHGGLGVLKALSDGCRMLSDTRDPAGEDDVDRGGAHPCRRRAGRGCEPGRRARLPCALCAWWDERPGRQGARQGCDVAGGQVSRRQAVKACVVRVQTAKGIPDHTTRCYVSSVECQVSNGKRRTVKGILHHE